MDAWMIQKSFLNVFYLNQAKDLMTASHWEHIYPLEKLFCLILIVLDFFFLQLLCTWRGAQARLQM